MVPSQLVATVRLSLFLLSSWGQLWLVHSLSFPNKLSQTVGFTLSALDTVCKMNGSADDGSSGVSYRLLVGNSECNNAEAEEIVWEMLLHAGHETDIQQVKSNPHLSPYAKDFGQQEGDWGIAAFIVKDNSNDPSTTRHCHKAIGAAWVRVMPGGGFAAATLEEPDKSRLAQLPELAIACLPEYRGQKVGRSLLELLLQSIRETKRHAGIVLSCRRDNTRAMRLYESVGFVKVPNSETMNRAGGTSITMQYMFSDASATDHRKLKEMGQEGSTESRTLADTSTTCKASDNLEERNRSIFIEIRPKDDEASHSSMLVEAYVVQLEDPKQCGPLLKRLGREIPLGNRENTTFVDRPKLDLTHLKRVRKPIVAAANTTGTTTNPPPHNSTENKTDSPSLSQPPNDNEKSPCMKKLKKSANNDEATLEILLRDVESLELDYAASSSSNTHTSDDPTPILEYLQKRYNLPPSTTSVVKRMVPRRPPKSQEEWQDFNNNYWPTLFFPQRFREFLEQKLQLSPQEEEQMKWGMEHAIQDYHQWAKMMGTKNTSNGGSAANGAGAVIVDPIAGQIVSRASNERMLQLQPEESSARLADTRNPQQQPTNLENPLATSILLAIQGVSRIERQKALEEGMDSSAFQKGQYLCTGFDLYTTLEPTVFEAMALVHSRIRRVVFGCTRPEDSGLQTMYIHALPSTNHHYRAFACAPGSALWNQCQEMLKS